MTKQADLWKMAPQCARARYEAMRAEHQRMCAHHCYEPREARALRRQMQIFYRYQCEAVRARMETTKGAV